MMKTTILTAALLAGTSIGAYAEGCGFGHSAQAASVVAEAETIADESQVLTTGQISVAAVDCTADPAAPECASMSTPTTN